MTIGTVQKGIHKGMSAGDVILSLGSPNIVTTDSGGRDVWVYDKFSTDETYSKDSGGGGIGFIRGDMGDWDSFGLGEYASAGLFARLPGINYKKSGGARSKTQRTLTVVIKFDDRNKVSDFAYHVSRF